MNKFWLKKILDILEKRNDLITEQTKQLKRIADFLEKNREIQSLTKNAS